MEKHSPDKPQPEPLPERMALVGWHSVPTDAVLAGLPKDFSNFLCGEPFNISAFFSILREVKLEKHLAAIQAALPHVVPSLAYPFYAPTLTAWPGPNTCFDYWYYGNSAGLRQVLDHCDHLGQTIVHLHISIEPGDAAGVASFFDLLARRPPRDALSLAIFSMLIQDTKERQKVCQAVLTGASGFKSKLRSLHVHAFDCVLLGDLPPKQAWGQLIQTTQELSFVASMADLLDGGYQFAHGSGSEIVKLTLREAQPERCFAIGELASIDVMHKSEEAFKQSRQHAAEIWEQQWMGLLRGLLTSLPRLANLTLQRAGAGGSAFEFAQALEIFLPNVTLKELTIVPESARWSLGDGVVEACLTRNARVPVLDICSKTLAADLFAIHQVHVNDLTILLGKYIAAVAKEDPKTAEAVISLGMSHETWTQILDIQGILALALRNCLRYDHKLCRDEGAVGAGYHVCDNFLNGVYALLECLGRRGKRGEKIPHDKVLAVIMAQLRQVMRAPSRQVAAPAVDEASNDAVTLTLRWLGAEVRTLSPQVLETDSALTRGDEMLFDAAWILMMDLRTGLLDYLRRTHHETPNKALVEAVELICDRLCVQVMQPFFETLYSEVASNLGDEVPAASQH